MSGLSRTEVAKLVRAADGSRESDSTRFARVSSIDAAQGDGIVFAQDGATLEKALASRAGLILGPTQMSESFNDGRVLWVRDARLAFAQVGQALARLRDVREIHPSAVIADDVILGHRIAIGAGTIVESGVSLGDDVVLGPRVVVHAGSELRDRVRVGAGSVLGGRGFGWVRDSESGEYVEFPQQGALLIEEDVTIGANCTIDRGALDLTRLGAGTKVDSLVHIAHSCRIGRRVVIAAQTGIAGSSEVGDGAVIAGQVGIGDHVQIGAGVVLGAKCGVPSHKQVRGAGQVFWGIPARPIKQYLRELAFLRRGLER